MGTRKTRKTAAQRDLPPEVGDGVYTLYYDPGTEQAITLTVQGHGRTVRALKHGTVLLDLDIEEAVDILLLVTQMVGNHMRLMALPTTGPVQ